MGERVATFMCILAAGVGVALLPSAAAGRTGSPPAGFNACKLLTKKEVAKAIGEPVARTQGGRTSTGARYCHWYGADNHFLERGVTVIAADNFAIRRYKLYKRDFKTNKPVFHVGDVAATNGEILIARRGDGQFLFISPLFNFSGVTVSDVKPLARKALGRIT